MNWTWLHKFASPPHAYRLAGRLAPWFGWPAFLLIVVGLYGGLVLAPPDYQQGDAFRILYVHAPSAWMSMFIYATMAVAAAIGLIWRIKLAHAVAAASAPVGAWFTFVALTTGAVWGKPMWGTWWVWDARLTSELILLFLYVGLIALRASIDDRDRADRASAVLAMVGVVNLPIIHYSVYWWNTLHQGATISFKQAPTMAMTMLIAMLLMTFAFWAYAFAVVFMRTRAIVLEREAHTTWVKDLTAGTKTT